MDTYRLEQTHIGEKSIGENERMEAITNAGGQELKHAGKNGHENERE